jgi:hypothetical protein
VDSVTVLAVGWILGLVFPHAVTFLLTLGYKPLPRCWWIRSIPSSLFPKRTLTHKVHPNVLRGSSKSTSV